jgi:putative hydrolase of HD superfamily
MAQDGEIKGADGSAGASHKGSVLPRDDRRITASGIPNANAVQEPWTVEAVVASIPGGAPEAGSSSPVPFFHMLERLKTTKREGWRRFGINEYASSAFQY